MVEVRQATSISLQQLHGGLQQSFPLAKGFALDEAMLDA